ncbi:hypothetical protein AHAS_Ahas15G0166700 [Arachis hypogaea]
MGVEPRIRNYVLRYRPFQHPLNNPLFYPDAPYEFPLSWLHPDAPVYPFPDSHAHLIPAQPLNQAALDPIVPEEPELVGDYVHVIPPE